jgi:hypothetical protein
MPVSRGFCLRYLGRTSWKKIENPSTKRFQKEFETLDYRFKRPTAVITLKSMQKKALSTGFRGMKRGHLTCGSRPGQA